jgi:arsenate reductase
VLPKLSVLFLCTGNSCRSQMAEGWARHLHGDRVEAASAGLEPAGLNPLAVRAMAEAGVEISAQRSTAIGELLAERFDLVVTVCDRARESCPVFPGAARTLHAGFDDPPWLARDARSEEEALPHYRRVRDEIRDFVAALPDRLADDPAPEGPAQEGPAREHRP